MDNELTVLTSISSQISTLWFSLLFVHTWWEYKSDESMHESTHDENTHTRVHTRWEYTHDESTHLMRVHT